MNEIGCKGKQKNRYTQILLYFFLIFWRFCLHMSKICSTFAPKLQINKV